MKKKGESRVEVGIMSGSAGKESIPADQSKIEKLPASLTRPSLTRHEGAIAGAEEEDSVRRR